MKNPANVHYCIQCSNEVSLKFWLIELQNCKITKRNQQFLIKKLCCPNNKNTTI